MTKEEIKIAIDKTNKIIVTKGYQTYSEYSFMIGSTNENQEAIIKALDYKNKDILTLASSGEQYFSAKFAGSKNITLYDINKLSILYTYLKIGAIKKLNYEDFINFLIPYCSYDKYLDKNTFLKVSDYLPDDTSNYWYNILSKYSVKDLELLILFPRDCKDFEYIKKGNPYYTRENYEILKKQIESENYPHFIASSIYDINKLLNNKKFDVIDTSNIIECILHDNWAFDCYSIETIPEWIKLVEKDLDALLKEKGQIIVDYDATPSTLIKHNTFTKYELEGKNKNKTLTLVYKKQ